MKTNINRRGFLKHTSMGLGALSLNPYIASANNSFQNPLNIPPLLEGVINQGIKQFQLTAQAGQTEFFKNQPTHTWGYNGAYLGPTIKVNKNDHAQFLVNNQLHEITTVHWHGMTLPARMDGGPHQEIKPATTWKSEYRIIQNASTLFYHSHVHGKTGEQVYKGLGGMLIIDDEKSQHLDLPTEYGVDDIPLILQDRDFDTNGQFNYISFMPERMIGKHGKTLLVNGGVSPVLKAQKTLIRFRILNASNARFYHLHFNDNRPFQVIASDGGLLQQSLTLRSLPIAPAERYEILVDVSDKKQLILQSLSGLGNASHGPMRMMGMDKNFNILKIDAQNANKSEHKIPNYITPYADWSEVNIAQQRSFDLQMGMMGGGMPDEKTPRRGMMMGQGMMNKGKKMREGMMRGNMMNNMMGGMMKINHQAFDMQRIDVRAKANTFEVWNISNDSPMTHPFHIHNTQFRVISRNGQAPEPYETGYKDTVIINPRDTVKVLIPMGPYSDPNIPYMYHCHILEHEDAGMMGQFSVEA